MSRLRLPSVRTPVHLPDDDVYVQVDVVSELTARSAIVSGSVAPGAGIFVQGGGAMIVIGGTVSDQAILAARGGGAEVIIMGSVR